MKQQVPFLFLYCLIQTKHFVISSPTEPLARADVPGLSAIPSLRANSIVPNAPVIPH
ncbi:hypothetical protein [Bacillus pseudomycoides]|uniref:hypothetical protein n=1 Tax=Bacillus pseudomycoides TaxID=64104 RepID=UPI0015CEFA36